MAELDELVKEFLVESNENLDRLDQDFVALEKDPGGARERLASIFRTIHTIKGTCGFLGFSKLESVTHVGESLLSRLRDGEIGVTSQIITALLQMVDAVREMLASIESGHGDGSGDYSALIETLTALKDQAASAGSATDSGATAGAEVTESLADLAIDQLIAESAQLGTVGATAPAAGGVSAPSAVVMAAAAGAPVASDEVICEAEALAAQAAEASVMGESAPAGDAKGGEGPGHAAAPSGGIRVDVGLLDKLMNLVGELVLARNQILQYSATIENATLSGSTQRLNLITTELQEGVMKTRMQPIGNIWGKFPRIVRDLSQMCGKRVRVEMEGRETELDKTIIEAIKDPLTHIIRNSVDHGIESPEKRRAAGKSEEGLLYLRAFHEGGQVNIEIIDDGGGINVERVKKKAVERGLITAEHASRMGEREATNLVFLPGFSTAEKVTNVSGRGVGMDVVKTNIEKIGGTVDIQSRPGQGTTLRIKIPLTLAIIPALIVTSGGDRFAIPQVSLLELVRVEGPEASTRIERVHGTPVYRLRGRLLPLVYLSRELGFGEAARSFGGASGLDFASAREKHLGWKRQLRDFIGGKAELSLDKAGTHRDCALGAWFDGAGGQEFGSLAEFKALESAHEQMHGAMRSAIAARQQGNRDAAEEHLRTVGLLSDEIVSLLTRLEQSDAASEVNIVVLQADGRQFGLVVDQTNDTEEIVVKPLGKLFKGLSTYAGATIMGDGRVALILDVMGLAQKAGVVAESRDRGLHDASQKGDGAGTDRQTLLLFRVSQTHRMAIPLSMVARLEEFQRDAIEMSGEQPVMQYRGGIMPLVDLNGVLGGGAWANPDRAPDPESDTMQVVVHSRNNRSIGLIVDRIVDVVEQTVELEETGTRPGVLGSAVIDGRVTEIVDLDGVIALVMPARTHATLAMAA